jgi:hypothetical protein
MGPLAASGQQVVSTAGAPSAIPAAEAAADDTPDASGFYIVPEPPAPDVALIGAKSEGKAAAKDLKNFDEPKEGIPQSSSGVMSKYVVQADRVPEFRIRDVNSKKGLEAIGFRDHPGLRVGNVFNDNAVQAYEMFLEDERLTNIQDYTDMALAMTVGGDKAEGDTILRAERETYNREARSDPLQSWENTPRTREGTPLILNLEQVRVTCIDVRF